MADRRDDDHRDDAADDAGRPRPESLWSAKRWFRAMAFPLIVVAAVLAWEGYRVSSGQRGDQVAPGWAVAYYIGAAACFGLGIAAVRMRHRSDQW